VLNYNATKEEEGLTNKPHRDRSDGSSSISKEEAGFRDRIDRSDYSEEVTQQLATSFLEQVNVVVNTTFRFSIPETENEGSQVQCCNNGEGTEGNPEKAYQRSGGRPQDGPDKKKNADDRDNKEGCKGSQVDRCSNGHDKEHYPEKSFQRSSGSPQDGDKEWPHEHVKNADAEEQATKAFCSHAAHAGLLLAGMLLVPLDTSGH